MSFHPLTIAESHSVIDGRATNVIFDVPPDLADTFRWRPGQHLTLRFVLNGREERRSYTISNPPGEALRITVKRVKGGLVSNHVGDALRPGDVVEVMPPFGGFVLEPGASRRRTHYFFAAGSGITPLYAMIGALLRNEPHSVAHLVYGNRAEGEILFREALDQLAEAHPDRLSLRHVLSSQSWLSWFAPWRTGRIEAQAVAAAIEEAPPVAQDAQYWICGPGAMNGDVRAALMAMDVPPNRIHMESFGGQPTGETVESGIAATARITLGGESRDVPVPPGQTILEAARAAGMEPPYSCQSGVCGACRARLTEGQVHMRARMALEDKEIENGDILTCQGLPVSDRVALRFEQRGKPQTDGGCLMHGSAQMPHGVAS